MMAVRDSCGLRVAGGGGCDGRRVDEVRTTNNFRERRTIDRNNACAFGVRTIYIYIKRVR